MSLSVDPAWLAASRAEAQTLLDAATPPDDAEEVWRYSRIADVDFGRFAGVDEPVSQIDALDESPYRVLRRDGFVTVAQGGADGLAIAAGSSSPDVAPAYGSVRAAGADYLAHLHDATVADPVLIDVTRGTHVPDAVVIDCYTDVDGGLTAPHTIVRAGAGASVTVLERRRSGPGEQLVLPTVEVDAAPDARVAYLVVQELGSATVCLEHHAISAGQQADVVASLAAFGGHYARTRIDFGLVGRGASGELIAAYFGDGDQMLDFRTFQEHRAPDTTSNLLFKGAVTGSAQSVYSGLIRVSEHAPGTNAFQTNRNLKLSDDAWAYSVPNLEIEQNQVACSHASTVGEIDDDQRFYLESRGVPPTVAEQLLVSGFFAEAIDKMPVASVRAELRAKIDDALAADRARRAET